MRVLSCFSKINELKKLALEGVNEVYCAVDGLQSFGDGGKIKGTDYLRKSADLAHSLGLKIFLAFNGAVSVNMDFRQVRNDIGRDLFMDNVSAALRAGADSFIVSNIAVMEALRRRFGKDIDMHLSSVQPCFNAAAAGYFIEGFGVSRIILPNLLSPREACRIIALCRKKGVETEIFDYRFFGCAYINGKCLLHDAQYYTFREDRPSRGGDMCRAGVTEVYDGKTIEARALCGIKEDSELLAALKKRVFEAVDCRGPYPFYDFSSFFDFFALGIDVLKYGTRSDPTPVKIAKARALRTVVDTARKYKEAYPIAEAKARFCRDMEKWDYKKEIPAR